jgi:hypothetical protein
MSTCHQAAKLEIILYFGWQLETFEFVELDPQAVLDKPAAPFNKQYMMNIYRYSLFFVLYPYSFRKSRMVFLICCKVVSLFSFLNVLLSAALTLSIQACL